MFKPVSGAVKVEPGKKYRITLQIKLAYKEANVLKIKKAIYEAEKWLHSLPDAIEKKFGFMDITSVSCVPATDRYFYTYVEFVGRSPAVNASIMDSGAMAADGDASTQFVLPVLAVPQLLALGGALVAVIGVATLGFVAVAKAFDEHVLEPVTSVGGLMLAGIAAYVILKMRG